MKTKKSELSEKLLKLVENVENGKCDELTFVQTAESILSADSTATSPWSFIRRLERRRRFQLKMVVFPTLKKVGRLSRDIKMTKACFKEIGADKK